MATSLDIVQNIEYSIMTGEYLPKQRLLESELAQRFSVGRSVIRESLRILQDRGSVVAHSNKGASVADFSPKEVRDLYFLRTRLERIAGILAYEHLGQKEVREMERLQGLLRKCDKTDIDVIRTHEAFHKVIFRASNNDMLTREIERLIVLSGPVRYRSYISPDQRRITIGQHDEIIDVLKKKERQAFLDLTHSHIFESLKSYLCTFHPTEAGTLIAEYEAMVAAT